MLSITNTKGSWLIDRSSPMPAYQQIATSLMKRISDGEWEVNEKIPSENDLAQGYGVSRVTMRQALALLEREYIIKKYQGKGIFVTANPKLVVQDLSFPNLNPNQRLLPSRLLSLEYCEPNRHIASQLKLDKNTPLIYLRRLFFQENKIIGVNNVWFPREKLPLLVQEGLYQNSVSKTLEHYGFEVVAIENCIESIKLDALNAQLLDAPYDSAALKIDSVHLLASDTRIEFASTIWVGDVTRFHLTVTKRIDSSPMPG